MLVTKTADLPSSVVIAGAETGKNKCHGWELRLALKQRHKGAREWPILQVY